MSDPFDLQRFLDAQDAGDTYNNALREVREGRKRSHWIWFVYPQIAGLGQSPTSVHFAISGRDEAAAYLEHPILRARLVESAQALLDLETSDPIAVFGSVDAMKLRSSMTLFAAAAPQQPVFQAVLDRFFNGAADAATLDRLR